ncbi:MAG: gliding motility protein GldN [Bacteroidia bacterium]
MNKRISSLVTVILLSINFIYAQNNVLDGAYIHENAPTLKVVGMPYLREADVMWSKKVWRYIDLSEKLNLPLKYPLANETRDRKSLISTLMDGVKEGTITPYNTIDDEFTQRMTIEEIGKQLGAGTDTQQVVSSDPPYLSHDTVVVKPVNPDKVIGYRIKEEWFFDKQRSVIEVRIIGLAPVMFDEDEFGNVREGGQKKAVCWFYFPEARNLLVNSETFNRENDAERRTYDDIFMKRMFSSTIIKESNVFNRYISTYRTGLDALLESEKIKSEIVNLEHDLWEY